MIDLLWLSQWIQPEHITDEAVRCYHHAYKAHPARLLQVRHCLPEKIAQRLYEFLATEAVYKTTYGLYNVADPTPTLRGDHTVSEAEWRESEEQNRFFRFGTGPQQDTKIGPGLLQFLKFRSAFHDLRFKQYLEAITETSLGPVTNFCAHRMTSEDLVRPHNDAHSKFHIAYIFYLNPYWKPDFGGALHVVDFDRQVTKIEADYNSLVFFDVTAHKEHFVEAIRDCAGDHRRLSLSGWINRPE